MVQRHAVFLVGYMGAGKTSVGQYVAARLKWSFVDLDDRIEAKAGRSVSEIFGLEGEPGFRRREYEVLEELVSELAGGQPTVVALGGGAFVDARNAALLEEFGARIIYLDAAADELWRRTNNAERKRPLRIDKADFQRRYEERLPAYLSGTTRVDTAGKTIAEVAAEVAWLIGIGGGN